MKAAIAYIKENNGVLKQVEDCLSRHEISFRTRHRDRLTKRFFRNADLAISVGGDGTFIRVSHHIFDSIPVMGVNVDTLAKEGFFAAADNKSFDKKLRQVIAGKARTLKVPRLEVTIGKRKIRELALNEVYIGSKTAYKTARYWLILGRKKEYQKSSGVLVGTAAGSHAWLSSYNLKTPPIDSDLVQYAVREPYSGKRLQCKMKKGEVRGKIEIISDMFQGMVVIDCLSREYRLKRGQKAVVKRSTMPLTIVQ
ncbi:hypothetical protein GF351_02975 [Candidatus Woesearchaeota archaeon]|nr:hypothetical protein [Candidatus Woesearchaeota archaeon]